MTLTQLEYILAVDAHLSFVRAAEACRVAQPSLSTQVLKLEEELGVKIFERSRAGVEVTDVGQEILAQARSVVASIKGIENICLDFRNEVRGTLRLGIIPTISPSLLPHFLPALTRACPDLRLEIEEDKTEALIAKLARGHLDAVVLSTPRNAPGSLAEKVLYYEPFVLFAGKGHELLQKKVVTLQDLKDHNPTLLDDTHCMRDQVEAVCGRSQSDSSVSLKAGTLNTLVQLVDLQNSYTLVPVLTLPALFGAGQLTRVRTFAQPVPTRRISLIFHATPAKRVLLKALEKAICENLPEEVLSTKKHAKIKILDPEARHFRHHS